MPIYKGKPRSMQFLANIAKINRETMYRRIYRYKEVGASEEEAVLKAIKMPFHHKAWQKRPRKNKSMIVIVEGSPEDWDSRSWFRRPQ